MSELPEGWASTQLGDLIDGFESGRNLKANGFPARERQFGVLKISAVTWGEFRPDENKALLPGDEPRPHEVVRKGDVLITRANTTELVGAVVEVKRDCPNLMLPDKILRLRRIEDCVEGPFLVRALRSAAAKAHFREQASGTSDSMRNLSQPKLAATPVHLPPLSEQKRIVKKVDALTEKSREAREALDGVPDLLDKLRQSILAAAFRGDLTKKWREQNPDVEPATALLEKTELPGGKSTGRSAGERVIEGRAALSVGDPDTPLPDGWARVPMLRIARLESGHTPSRQHPEWWGGDVHWIGIGDARDNHGKTIFTTEQKTNAAGLANSAARLLPANTVCVSRTASVGYVTKMGVPMATSQDFVNWVCTSALLPDYLLFAFLAEGEHLRKFGEGTTHTTIYFPEVKAFHLALPPLEEQKQIVKLVQERIAIVERMLSAEQQQRALLKQLDPSVLAKAFRGELVPQDPNDEPASVLLERIRLEREAGPQKNGASKDGKKPVSKRRAKRKS